MPNTPLHRFKTIAEFHEFRGLPKPQHPLISVVNVEDLKTVQGSGTHNIVNNFYTIALKRSFNARMRYGQQEYDFDAGIMFFIAPNQVYSIQAGDGHRHSGWTMLIHPDFLWNTHLGKAMKQYEFFSYAVNEALHLSEKEENTIEALIRNIALEYQSNIDNFSQDLIVAQLEVLLTYANRFYHRQFLTRKISNHKILERLERLLSDYFDDEHLTSNGLPTVQYISDKLHVSPNYLSGLLKILTGQSTQQHIHDKLIEKAKEKLSGTDLSVSEIAYGLGFEHPQSFSKLFKVKTTFSPLEFRQSFN